MFTRRNKEGPSTMKTFNDLVDDLARMYIEDGFIYINKDGLVDSTNTTHTNTPRI